WWLIAHVIRGDLAPPIAANVNATMRVLLGLGPEALAQEEALRRVELLGVVMNGVPPRNDEEWELARSLFDEDALAEFARWEPMGHPGWGRRPEGGE
ncbi:MAG: hypothetical protein ACR2HN_00690, partial [Tepidiformaceae bacterium]